MTPQSRSPLHAPAAGGRAALPGWVREMAGEVDLDALREVVVARDVAAAFPDLAGDEEFVERLRASVEENLRALQGLLCGRLALADIRLTEPLVFGAVQARLRIPQSSLQRSYRVGFVAMWEEWARRLRLRAEEDGLAADEAVPALEQLTSTIFGYQDHVASQVAESHTRADDALNRSRAHVRQGLVRQLLRADGAPLAPSDLLVLDYPLSAAHVLVLLPAVAEGTARQLVPGLASAARTRRSLVHPVDLSGTAVWLAQPSAWTPAARAGLAEKLAALDVEASVSGPAAGLEGFRDSWQQVEEVQAVRSAWGRAHAPRVLQHADVGLEVLLLQDPVRGRRFVVAELGPLAEDSEQAERLRETLVASFRWGSHVAAAEHLHLHEHTVRNRLHKAEEQLGRSLQVRRTELQVALRLHRLLAGAAPPGG